MRAPYGLLLAACACALGFACDEPRDTPSDAAVRDATASAEMDGGGSGASGGDAEAAARDAAGGASAIGDATAPGPDADADANRPPSGVCAVDADADAGDDAAALEPLLLELPAHPPVGLPFIVAVSTASGAPLTTTATLCVDGQPTAELRLYRGRGSAPLLLDEPGAVLLRVVAPDARGERAVQLEARPRQPVSGALGAGDITWGADTDRVLQGDVQLPAGATLTIEAGARVLFEELASLQVSGTLRVLGTVDAPVLLTRAGTAAWGGIELLAGSRAELAHAWFTAGGGDGSRAFGHSDSQPVISLEDAVLEMNGGGVVDNPGKAFGARFAHMTLEGVLVSRCDTGGELRSSAVTISHGHVLEMPDADGEVDDNDNDGLYLLSAMTDAEGAPVESLISDSVFANGEDDAIDHNGAQVRLERVWIEGFHHEGVAASNMNRVTVVDSVVRGCANGIEAGYGTPEVIVEHSLLIDNGVGLRFGDAYNRDTGGSLTARHSIALDNREYNLRNHVRQLDGPLPGALRVACSMVGSAEYDGLDGNLAGRPEGAWQERGCAEGPALTGSGCDGEPPGPRSCF